MNNSHYDLRDKWKQRDGPEVLWVTFETFFIQRLNLCDFTFIWKSGTFVGNITNFIYIGAQNIFNPSLRNLSARLSTPVALLVLNSFKIFRIDTELTFSNLRFFFHGS